MATFCKSIHLKEHFKVHQAVDVSTSSVYFFAHGLRKGLNSTLKIGFKVMETSLSRQGELVGWMFDNGVTFKALAEHCGKTSARISDALKSETVPTKLHTTFQTFITKSGSKIPKHLLPAPLDRKTGPEPGWIERKIAKARRSGLAESA